MSLSKSPQKDVWKDVREICFTIFADEKYMLDEKGYVKIYDLSLCKID